MKLLFKPITYELAFREQEIVKSIGDWFFSFSELKAIDCPCPSDKNCQHQEKSKEALEKAHEQSLVRLDQ